MSTFLNLAKNDEIMSKNQFTGTAMQPIDGYTCTQHFTCELPKMTTLHFKKSTVVFKDLILT